MEQEAVFKEQISLESQLNSMRMQITHLNLEVDEQKAKVNLNIIFGKFIGLKLWLYMSLSQVVSIRKDHDQINCGNRWK